MPMPGTLTLDKRLLAKRFEGRTDPAAPRKRRAPAHAYNIALVCGQMIQIFTPDRFHELPTEVERLLAWGNELADIDLQLLEADDPFQ